MNGIGRRVAWLCVLAAMYVPAFGQTVEDVPGDPELAIARRDALIEEHLPALRDDGDAIRQGIEQVVAYQQRMLDNPALADHWARPIWMADLAQKLLLSTLPEVYLAGDFSLVGYPNDVQRQATDAVATTAMEWLNRAEAEHKRLAPVLRGREDFVTELVNTGYWDAFEQYAELNIPYARAWAAVYLMSREDSADQQSRLAAQAAADLVVVREHAADYAMNADTQARLELLTAELAIHNRDTNEALRALSDAAVHADAQPITRLLAGLMRARTLQQAGRFDEAAALLQELQRSDFPGAGAYPLHRVLIADRMFSIGYQQATVATDEARRAELLNQAFEVYATLLGGELGEWQPAVARFVEQRYMSQLPAGLSPQQWPGPVQLASAKQSFDEAERLRTDSRADDSQPIYQRAADSLETVLKRDDLGTATHAEAMFYLGAARVRLNQSGIALQTLIDLAERYPQMPRGEQAIRIAAVSLAPALFEAHPDNAQLLAMVERMYRVLLEQYSTIDLAQAAAYDYASFLRQTGRCADAINAYDKIDDTHPSYIAARFQRLMCMESLWQEGPPAERNKLAEAIVVEVDRVVLLAGDPPTMPESVASALVLKARAICETRGDTKQAWELLERVRNQYGNLPGVAAQLSGLSVRIRMKEGRYDLVEQELREYAKEEPDEAGRLAVEVLDSIKGNADLAPIAVRVADDVVLPWARGQTGLSDEQRLAYEIIPAKAMFISGQYGQALDRFNAIVRQFGQIAEDNMDVVMGRAEASYQLKRLDESAAIYNRIIRWGQQNDRRDADIYWQAILRVYQIQDAQLGEQRDAGIARGIDRLQQEDSALGGPACRWELLKLRDKHAPK